MAGLNIFSASKNSLAYVKHIHKNALLCVQVNEAFAVQFLSVEKELGLDRERTNVNGGAIALGHPLAASGSRITAHLVHEMRRRNVRYSIGSACIGGLAVYIVMELELKD